MTEPPGRNGRGRVPDASRTMEFEETDASWTRPQPFLPGGTGHARAMPAPRPRHSCQIVANSPRHGATHARVYCSPRTPLSPKRRKSTERP
eukprot:gene18350-biopygen5411